MYVVTVTSVLLPYSSSPDIRFFFVVFFVVFTCINDIINDIMDTIPTSNINGTVYCF